LEEVYFSRHRDQSWKPIVIIPAVGLGLTRHQHDETVRSPPAAKINPPENCWNQPGARIGTYQSERV